MNTLLDRKFTIKSELGSGSAMTAYLCTSLESPHELVVVKVLSPDVARDRYAVDRIRGSVTEFKNIHHPNLLRVYDIFEQASPLAYSLEFAQRGDLESMCDRPQNVAQVIQILRDVARGLAALHSAGILHRNIKPGKVFLGSDGTAKLGESSIARTASANEMDMKGVVATIEYIAPESLLTGEFSEKSDIYALGYLGFVLLTGKSPFERNTVIETMTARLGSNPSVHELRSDCPRALSDAILLAMQREPSDRFQNATAFERALVILE